MARGASDSLVLDIETVPDLARWHPPEAAPGSPAPAVFPPTWAHRVIVVGYARFDGADRLISHGVIATPENVTDADGTERSLIEGLTAAIGSGPRRPILVTYNGRGFDLPVLALRALCHGVALPWYYRDRNVRARHSDDGHLDLCDWLADHGAIRAGSLDALARLVGLPGKGEIDGAHVEPLYRAGDLAAIEAYCVRDVVQTAFLYLRVKLLQGRLDRAAYRARATALLAQVGAAIPGAVRERLLLADTDG